MNKCKNCKWYEMDYDDCCAAVENHQEPGTDFHLDVWVQDDQGLDARLRVGPEFGCMHFQPKDLVRVPPNFLIERPSESMFSTWDDLSNYLQKDPHPEYRLVTASVINGVTRCVWELK